MSEPAAPQIEQAFSRVRQELEIRSDFPDDVTREADRVAAGRRPVAGTEHADRTDIPFVTVDPPGSRDLDQAVHAESRPEGYLLQYAIADVGFWVDRGSEIEKEAWQRGVTFYAPDAREPLYPPALSAGVASLLPDQVCPAMLFTFELDARGELRSWTIEKAVVRSRRQLTYAELLEGAINGRLPGVDASEEWLPTLPLVREIGELRMKLEIERGGVSLPLRDQQVMRRTALEVGYSLNYETPNEAERWNEQISLLTGHAAAEGMLAAGIGILRTMPPIAESSLVKLREIARTLGFDWDAGQSYADFLHSLNPAHPRIEVLVRQARRVIRGADYIFFQGAPPEQPLHGALALTYAHVTAPLRRLADRYVLDLLVDLAAGRRPGPPEIDVLAGLPPVMNAADTKAGKLERRIVDIAEAAALEGRLGDELEAVVVDVRDNELEFQVEEPPVRASVSTAKGNGSRPLLGERVRVRVLSVDVCEGTVGFELAAR